MVMAAAHRSKQVADIKTPPRFFYRSPEYACKPHEPRASLELKRAVWSV
jgi:hypothetical protein